MNGPDLTKLNPEGEPGSGTPPHLSRGFRIGIAVVVGIAAVVLVLVIYSGIESRLRADAGSGPGRIRFRCPPRAHSRVHV